jgi:3-(methylthio)propanoyl-CoA dehydrogenase
MLQALSDRLALARQQAQNLDDVSHRDSADAQTEFLSVILDSFAIKEESLERLAQEFLADKIIQDRGKTAQHLIEEITALAKTMQRQSDMRLKSMGATLGIATLSLDRAVEWVIDIYPANPQAVAVGAVPFLKCCRIVIGAWLLGSQSQDVQAIDPDKNVLDDCLRSAIAAFYFHQVLPVAMGLSQVVRLGEEAVLALSQAEKNPGRE